MIRLELRDKSFNLLEILDNEFMNLSWEYNRIGGCGSIQFDLPREYCNERSIGGDFNLRVYMRNSTTKAYDLWYQGVVETRTPDVRSTEEVVSIQGQGYQVQLSRIQLVGLNYASQEVSVILKNILDNYVVPVTDITYDVGDIVNTGYTIDSIDFNTDALNAIQTLADIVGLREWGVDKDRKFFFKQRSSTVGFSFPLGRNITAFNSDDSFRDVVNRIIVQGGDVADVPFSPDASTAPYNDLSSQLKYGRRDQVYQNSSIVTDDVAEQFAQSILAEKGDVIRRARCELVDYETRVESTIPIPLLNIVAKGILYGEREYGTFLYSGRVNYQVNRIIYRSENSTGDMKISLELGQPKPNIAETIGQLRYKLEQLRSASL